MKFLQQTPLFKKILKKEILSWESPTSAATKAIKVMKHIFV